MNKQDIILMYIRDKKSKRAIAGETGIAGSLIGTIDMYDKYTFVEVPKEYARDVLNAMSHARIKGRNINIEPANRK